jgi:hypothetical protein
MLVRKNIAGVIHATGSARTERISRALRRDAFPATEDKDEEDDDEVVVVVSRRRRRRATFFSRLVR